MFQKFTNEQIASVWREFVALFVFQVLWVWAYAAALRTEYVSWSVATAVYSVVQFFLCIQNIYYLHDVLHVAPFPPAAWMKYITHPFSDLLNLGWQDVMLEHKRHHVATADVLHHGEFAWDPSELQFYFQELSSWTAPLCYIVQLLGFYDTGIFFMLGWYWAFPDENALEPVFRPRSPEDRKKTIQRRIQTAVIQLAMWYGLIRVAVLIANNDLQQFLPIFAVVLGANRVGWATAWYFFANINHSEKWNELLAEGQDRKHPILDAVLCVLLGGRARVNEMKFHDLHHAFPNKIGALSMRGRFYDWDRVREAALKITENGIFEEDENDLESAAGSVQTQSTKSSETPAEDSSKLTSEKLNQLQVKRSSFYQSASASSLANTTATFSEIGTQTDSDAGIRTSASSGSLASMGAIQNFLTPDQCKVAPVLPAD
jgi:hypothetical protein